MEFRDTAAKGTFLGGLLVMATGAVTYLLAILPALIFYDVLLFSTTLRFTLETSPLWQGVAVLYFTVGAFLVTFAIIYRLRVPGPRLTTLAKVAATIQACFPPAGTFFGVVLWHEVRARERASMSTKPAKPAAKVDLDATPDARALAARVKRDVGHATAYGAILHLAFLGFLFALTVYLSTVQLDLTYPYLTMRTITWIRAGLWVLVGLFGGQVGLGLLYARHADRRAVRAGAYLYGVFQLPFFPVGTYLGALLLRDLRYDVAAPSSEQDPA